MGSDLKIYSVTRALTLAGLCILGATFSLLTAVAQAGFTDGALVASASPFASGDGRSEDVSLSQDASWAVFATRALNLFDDPDPVGEYRTGGVFRKDLRDGSPRAPLAIVAGGSVRHEQTGDLIFCGAERSRPAVGASGRFVAFSTEQPLVVEDTNLNPDVYVRDMDIGPDTPGAYQLVSARDGSDLPATYASSGAGATGCRAGSALPLGGRAISADGRRILFSVTQAADLLNHPDALAPAFQLYVRDLDTKRTSLVTVDRTVGGPVGPAASPRMPTGSISADGTTVAWLGVNAPQQTRFISGEFVDDSQQFYMWRRIADGASARTRRITGMVDLDDPACNPSVATVDTGAPMATGPCYGPLTAPEENSPTCPIPAPPSLSGDGYRVAFTVCADLRPSPQLASSPSYDAFVTDMSSGATRKSATTELTSAPGGELADTNRSITGVAISGDGNRIALASHRSVFVRALPKPIGRMPVNGRHQNVFLIDLAAGTLELVTRGLAGADANGSADSAISLSTDGARVGFASDASNLFGGDARGQKDVFTALRLPDPIPSPPLLRQVDKTEPLPPLAGTGKLRLRILSKKLRRGHLILRVRVPAAGRLSATGKQLKRASRRAVRAQDITLKLRAAGSLAKRIIRGSRVAMRVRLRFAGQAAPPLETRVSIAFKPTRAKTRR